MSLGKRLGMFEIKLVDPSGLTSDDVGPYFLAFLACLEDSYSILCSTLLIRMISNVSMMSTACAYNVRVTSWRMRHAVGITGRFRRASHCGQANDWAYTKVRYRVRFVREALWNFSRTIHGTCPHRRYA